MSATVQRLAMMVVIGVVAVPMMAQQTTSGSITGAVTDPNGAMVPAAKIVAKHAQNGTTTEVSSTEAGIYLFPSLPVGPYSLTVSHPGFKQLVRSNLEVRIGSRITVDLRLEIGETQQSIEVSAESPLLETTSPQRGTALLPVFMDKLPLYSSGIRNAESFVSYMPGVNSGASETSISGSGGRAKEILIDGGSGVSPESGGMAMQNIGAEALTEFKLTTGSYSADLGRMGGGVELFNTKSGTNQMHGSAFWSLRRDIFNAAGWASNSALGRTPGYRGKERYNEAGGSIGGPVYIPKVYDGRNRTFFFFAYSRDLRPESFGFGTYTVPTVRQRQGDFTEAGLLPLYDPSTTQTVNGVAVRSPFPGNIVPRSRWSKVSGNVVQYIPDPTGPGITSNYTHANTSKFENDIWSIKADHQFNAAHRIAVFLQRYTDSTAAETAFPGYLGTANTSYNKPDTLRNNHDWIIRPNILLHSMFSYSSTRSTWNNPLQRGFATKVGLPTQGGDSDATPVVGIGGNLGYSGWGQSDGKVDNGGQWNYTYQVTQGLSWLRNKHEIKVGFDLRRLQTKGHDMARTQGTYSFSSNQTADPTNLTRTGNGFASLLLGVPTSASQAALPITDSNIRYGYHAVYFQDNWRLHPRLTLELGLRYEVPKGWHYVNGNYSTVDLKTSNPGAANMPGALVFAGTGPGRQNKIFLYPTDWSNIGPRIGFAYRVSNKTVLRGGWGIYYQALGNGGCGCTSGFNYTASVSGDGVNPFINWDGGVPFPANYKAPPVIDPTYQNTNGVSVMGDSYGKAPRYYSWSLSLQREMKGFLVECAYVGNRGRGLNSSLELNQLPFSALSLGTLLTRRIDDPAVVAAGYKEPFTGFLKMWTEAGKASQATLAQALKLYPQYAYVDLINSGQGRTWYDSAQLKIERRVGALTLMGNYTFSKSLAMMHLRQIFDQSSYGAQDSYNVPDAKSYSPMDQTHVASILSVYQLPFGKGKKLMSSTSRAVNALVGGWSVSAAQKYNSGNLIRLSSVNNLLGTYLNANTTKAIVTGLPVRTGVSRTDLDPNNPNVRWFNSGTATPYKNVTGFNYGTASFYQPDFRQPPVLSENVSLMKAFVIREKLNAKFRADAFNIFNRTCFGGVNGTVENANFGRPTGVASGPRVITLGFRLEF
jgi:hypothetical protein